MLDKLFFKLLPVQILIVAMGSINSIVDGVVAGRCIDAASVGVIGLYYTFVRILEAVGGVLLGGTAVLCGRYLGSGELKKTNGVFSLNLTVTFLIGATLTIISFLLTGPLATGLGATEELKPALMGYITGYAVGIIPQLLAQQIAMFLQLERQSTRGYVGVSVMIISNIVLDLVFVMVLDMGTFGLALATGLSNVAYFLVLVPYYFSKKVQLKFSLRQIPWRELLPLVKIGFPGALLVFCLAIRNLILNNLLLTYAGNDGLSASSAFGMICGLEIAFCLGNGSVVRMMASVFFGEEDRISIRKLMKTALTKGLIVSVLVGALMAILAGPMAGLFFSDPSSNVYALAKQLFFIYALCIPVILIIQVFSNYLQAAEHSMFVNIISVFDGFISMVLPAWILAPVLGALGIWLAYPIGIVLTFLVIFVYVLIYQKHFPKTFDDWLFFPANFGIEEVVVPEGGFPEGAVPLKARLDYTILAKEDVTKTSEAVQSFCNALKIPSKTGLYAALSLEEMAGNVVNHGFSADKKKHSVLVSVIKNTDSLLLRLKDDCIPFDPKEKAEHLFGSDPAKNIGIRMIQRLSDEMTYQNLLGMNVLSVRFSGQ